MNDNKETNTEQPQSTSPTANETDSSLRNSSTIAPTQWPPEIAKYCIGLPLSWKQLSQVAQSKRKTVKKN